LVVWKGGVGGEFYLFGLCLNWGGGGGGQLWRDEDGRSWRKEQLVPVPL